MTNILRFSIICAFLLTSFSIFAQSTKNDIPVKSLPAGIKTVLEQYIGVLRNSASLDECAQNFVAVAGGGLVNEDGSSLRSSVQPYSLKKDFDNIKFYANPIQITRVNVSESQTSGFGASAITGKIYKVWIAKANGQAGLPAPVSIMLPNNGGEAKVVGIGSF